MTGFGVDLADMRKLLAAVRDISDQVSGLNGEVDAAILAPGTFTQLPPGRRLDGMHSMALRRVRAALKSAVDQIAQGADNVHDTADSYGETDADARRELEKAGRRVSDDSDSTIGASSEASGRLNNIPSGDNGGLT